MKKFFKILLKSLGVLLLLMVIAFLSLWYYTSKQKYYGEWEVVSIDGNRLPSNTKMIYYLYKDDWGCYMGLTKEGDLDVTNFKFERDGDKLLMKESGHNEFSSYDFEVTGEDADKWMKLKKGNSEILMKFEQDLLASSFYNKGHRQELMYNPVVLESEKNEKQSEFQLFANGFTFWDGAYGLFDYKKGSDFVYELKGLRGDKFAEMDFNDIDNHKIKLTLTDTDGSSTILKVSPKTEGEGEVNNKPYNTETASPKTGLSQKQLQKKRMEFACNAIMDRIKNIKDARSGDDLDGYLQYLLSKWERDANDLYGTGENIFNDGIWHIGNDHWDEKLLFQQEDVIEKPLNGQWIEMYYLRFELYYGDSKQGYKDIVVYQSSKDGSNFKVYDIKTDNAINGYWTRQELKKHYRDELENEGAYFD